VKISLLLPVYNEFLTLPLVLQRVLEAPLPDGCEKEVIVVDDGSTDGTTEVLRKYAGSAILVHHSVVNFGKGAALRIGIGSGPAPASATMRPQKNWSPKKGTTIVGSPAQLIM